MSDTKNMPLAGDAPSKTKTISYLLWVLQCVLALLFLFAGIMKLITPAETLAKQAHMSGAFLKFIGVAETLGGLGMVLPGLLRILQGLIPLAAAGLIIIMIGAVITTLQAGMAGQAIFPLVTGILLIFVAYGRWRLAPLG